MRVDAFTPLRGAAWMVWDCERCCEIDGVLWIDDQLHEYEYAPKPFRLVNDEIYVERRSVRRVEIYLDRLLILVNPVPADGEEPTKTEAVGTPMVAA